MRMVFCGRKLKFIGVIDEEDGDFRLCSRNGVDFVFVLLRKRNMILSRVGVLILVRKV